VCPEDYPPEVYLSLFDDGPAVQTALEGFKAIADQSGFELVLATMPVLTSGIAQLEGERVRQMAADLAIETFDVLEGLGPERRLEDMRIAEGDDIHLGSDGHRIVGELLTVEVRRIMAEVGSAGPDRSAEHR